MAQQQTELPGLTEKDIDVSLSRDVLTISGEKKQETQEIVRASAIWKRRTDSGGHKCSARLAFYSDCEHEVLPLREGIRLCLVYNLVFRNSKGTLVETTMTILIPMK